MKHHRLSTDQAPTETDGARLPELDYQKRFIRRIIFTFLPLLALYAFQNYLSGHYLQAFLFGLWCFNGIVALTIGSLITTVQGLIRLKWYSVTIGFILLIIALLHGVVRVDLFEFLPLCFWVPIGLIFVLGRRTGFATAVVFCIVVAVLVAFTGREMLAVKNITMFKINSVVAFIVLMVWAYITERTRLRVQKNLIQARNNYKGAEERQRIANAELQREIELRAQSEKSLAQSEMRYRALFEESAVSLWEEDFSSIKSYLDELPLEAAEDLFAYFKQNPSEITKCVNMMKVTAVNRATLDLYEADSSERLLNRIVDVLPPCSSNYMIERIVSLYLNRRYDAEHTAHTLTGRPLHLLIRSNIPVGYEDSFQKVFTSVYDVTERVAMDQEKKRVEHQLQQARQMQAVATLAGGIAHQFNNALGVIFGGLDLIEMNAKSDSKNKHFFDTLKSSANRMSRLTDQLLAYAHGGKYQPKSFSVNDLIHSILDTKKIVPGPSVRVSTELAPQIHMACGDTTQIKMVIEAVLANAFESMADGGEVKVGTYNQVIDGQAANQETALAKGSYAVVQVQDTGSGMDAETIQRIFEPFFTTKFFGRGLGMAAAYGIISNHDGMIKVYSTPKKGTRVHIFLPADDAQQIQPSEVTKEPQTVAS